MKAIDFKIKLNNLLCKSGSIRQIDKVSHRGVNIALIFKNGIDMKTIEWLNRRFHYGIHMIEGVKNTIYINSPLEKKVIL